MINGVYSDLQSGHGQQCVVYSAACALHSTVCSALKCSAVQSIFLDSAVSCLVPMVRNPSVIEALKGP